MLAEVKATGSSRNLASSIMNSHWGMRMPIEAGLSGFKSDGKVDLRSKTKVTGPGSKVDSWLSESVTLDHLYKYILESCNQKTGYFDIKIQ